jgi:hypothetical protein
MTGEEPVLQVMLIEASVDRSFYRVRTIGFFTALSTTDMNVFRVFGTLIPHCLLESFPASVTQNFSPPTAGCCIFTAVRVIQSLFLP